jgi:uncharacterized membrane protein (UPF0127 family)
VVEKEKLKKWLLPILAVGLLILAGISLFNNPGTEQVHVLLPNGQAILADVADSPEEQLVGLFFTESLPPDRGLLLIYEEAGLHRVWTKNIRSSIDIIWLAPNRQIVQVDENIPPCTQDPCPTYGSSDQAVLFALEVAAGTAREHGLVPGVSLEFRRVPSGQAQQPESGMSPRET